jgi:phosphatidate cytidylyltransferase
LNNFNSRVLIGGIYVLISIAALLVDQITAVLYLALIQWACLNEFYKIVLNLDLTNRLISTTLGTIIFAEVFANQDHVINLGSYAYWIIPLVIGYMSYLVLFQRQNLVRKFTGAVAGWVYISCSLALLLRNGNLSFDTANLDMLPYSGIQILIIFILIWLNDTFAYLVGRKFGKNALASSISPKKTWEGFIGGALFTLISCLALQFFFPFLTISNFLILGVIVVIFSTLGDLFESQIKRDLGIKDSGTALGGHGGFLDRFDSILLAGPACYFYLFHIVGMS